MKSVSADCPHHEACTAAQVLTWQGWGVVKWARRDAKKGWSGVKWGCAGFCNQHNFERSPVLAGVASYWRSRQPQPPCLDRTGVSRILMSTRGKEKEREKGRGGTQGQTRQNTEDIAEEKTSHAGLEKKKCSGVREVWIMNHMDRDAI